MTIEIARPQPDVTVPASSPASSVGVLVCGDQPLNRAGLASIIGHNAAFRAAGESTLEINELSAALARFAVDLVVIEFDFGEARDCASLERILDTIAPRPVIVVTTALASEECQSALAHGASGVVLKAHGADVLLSALESAHRGQVWLDRDLLNDVFDNTAARRRAASEQTRIEQLTPREREIFQVACTGITNKQIAEQLSISEATVRHHLGSIFAKLGVSTRSELVVYGYRHKFAEPTPAQ